MQKIRRSVYIDDNIDRVFKITNDLSRWVELFGGEYSNVNILEAHTDRVKFELTNEEGRKWVSVRHYDLDGYAVHAERLSPKFPFKFMKIYWDYQVKDHGTLMTWRQEFEVDDSLSDKKNKIYHFILDHTEANQKRIKKLIETEKNECP